jgi:hypothetical protein
MISFRLPLHDVAQQNSSPVECANIFLILIVYSALSTQFIDHKLHLNREQKGAQGQQDMHNGN